MQSTAQTLHDRQLQLESESTSLGIARYEKARANSDEADTGPGKKLVMQAVAATGQAIREFVEKAKQGGGGRRHTAVKWLEHLDPEGCAYLTAVVCVNALAGEQAKLTAVARSVGSAIAQDVNYKKLRDNHAGLYRVIQQQLKKSTSAHHSTGVMNHALAKTETEMFVFTPDEEALVGMKLIDLFIEASGLAEIILTRPRQNQTVAILQGTAAIREWLAKAHESASMFLPVWMPMLVPPKDWTTPRDGGYLTDIGGRADLVRTRNRAYKRELEQADMPNVYRAVNLIQSTPWKINKPILEVMQDAWAVGGGFADLPDRDLLELPEQPALLVSDPEFYKEHHADEFKAWKRSRAEVYEENARGTSRRLSAAQKIALAEKFKDEAAIYFPHNLDFRGRVYPIPSILTPQGDDQAKALLTLAEGVPLGEDGAFWLAVHVANCFGVDKVAFAERVSWVRANEEMILDSALNPLDGQRAWSNADSPFCALAACFEWLGYSINGNEHMSHLPVALDGSCNGLQNFSAMLRDSVGGAATNLLPQDKPADIYTAVMDVAAVRVRAEAEAGNACALFWDGALTRGIVKQPVMTLPYGVTKSGMRGQVQANAKKEGLSPSNEQAAYLGDILWDCIGEVVVAARQAMDWLKEASKVASASDLPIAWTTPAGFPVLQEYREDLGKRVTTHIGGKRVELIVAMDGSKLDRRRQGLGISPNFVHSCDASHLMLTTCLASDNGITSFAMIHDSYGMHAGNTGILAASLRHAFIEQYESDVLGNFRTELAEQLPIKNAADLPKIPPFGDLDLSEVLESSYFFA
ncbi:DNA-directed RNA polymerase [Xanthomonas euvesicatoria]|uniref:DNA-directed RNA polymerase n=1 Tax=Xanthomonas euvesicatoria TaxID=456327 RepID=A0AAW3U1M6_XANEU|nr:DNA-directed RNA polymerase [Xanthomonas euvesicatoria]MBB4722620.1 DNA-directed RNA polymerase [Xanthomonas euvesicatoria]MBB4869212.1 DNA-directed RNA polymerase [Xanthomonas euvesicatoria]